MQIVFQSISVLVNAFLANKSFGSIRFFYNKDPIKTETKTKESEKSISKRKILNGTTSELFDQH